VFVAVGLGVDPDGRINVIEAHADLGSAKMLFRITVSFGSIVEGVLFTLFMLFVVLEMSCPPAPSLTIESLDRVICCSLTGTDIVYT
jgi:hypothetical protein